MITKQFAAESLPHSLLGFGAMRLPTLPEGGIDMSAGRALVDRAIAGGVNYFDTGYTYHDGASEAFLRDALAKYPRESYYLADKMPLWAVKAPEDLERIFSDQLARCGVDYFDFYLTHAFSNQHLQTVKRFDIIPFLARKKAEGKIRHLGFSFHDDAACLKMYLGMHDWDFCQLQLNYADWNRNKAKELYRLACDKKVPVFVMEPVRGGFLADPPAEVAELLAAAEPHRSAASWALRFVASLPEVALVLSGMSTIEQVEENLKTFVDAGVLLSDGEQAVMERAIQKLDSINSIPCTGCRYCMPCPFGVKIPEIFAIYNHFTLFHRGADAYMENIPQAGRADQCTACGACVALCPQGIAIPDRLEEAHSSLRKKKE